MIAWNINDRRILSAIGVGLVFCAGATVWAASPEQQERHLRSRASPWSCSKILWMAGLK